MKISFSGMVAPLTALVLVGSFTVASLSGYEAPQGSGKAKAESVSIASTEAATQSAAVATTAAALAAGSGFDVKDGTYTGVGKGYSGDIKVEVDVKDKKITAIRIVSTSDTAAFFNRAKAVIDEIIKAQSLDVDTVSGATYSSRGIIAAVKNALTGEEDTSSGAPASTASGGGDVSVGTVAESGSWKDGTYTGSGQGFGGTTTVEVVIQGGKIASIRALSNHDTAAYWNRAKGLMSQMVAKNSTNVAPVSGATFSSRGIIQAVRNALAKAGGADVSGSAGLPGGSGSGKASGGSAGKVSTVTVPAGTTLRDGTYEGSGQGFGGTTVVRLTVKNGKIASLVPVSHHDTAAYWNRAKVLFSRIVQAGSTKVDTVSGATFSSRGIIEAAGNALKKAMVNGGSQTQNNSSAGKSENSGGGSNSTPSQKNDTAKNFPYPDGIYYGTGRGWGGKIQVGIVIQDSRLVNIVVTDKGRETESIFSRAKTILAQMIAQQKVDVDTVSGATKSSNGLIAAVKDALEQAKKKAAGDDSSSSSSSASTGSSSSASSTTARTGSSASTATTATTGSSASTASTSTTGSSASTAQAPQVYRDGTYTGRAKCTVEDGEDSWTYDVTLKVTVEKDQITAITDVSGTGDENDQIFLETAAEELVPGLKGRSGTDGVSVVSGATYSSRGILDAVNDALTQAKN